MLSKTLFKCAFIKLLLLVNFSILAITPFQNSVCMSAISQYLAPDRGEPLALAKQMEVREAYTQILESHISKWDEYNLKTRKSKFLLWLDSKLAKIEEKTQNESWKKTLSHQREEIQKIISNKKTYTKDQKKTLEEYPAFSNSEEVLNSKTGRETLEHIKFRAHQASIANVRGSYRNENSNTYIITGREAILDYLKKEEFMSKSISKSVSKKLNKKLPIYRASNFAPFFLIGGGLWSSSMGFNQDLLLSLIPMALTGSGAMASLFKALNFSSNNLSFLFSKKLHKFVDYEYAKHLSFIRNSLDDTASDSSAWSYYGRTTYTDTKLLDAVKKERSKFSTDEEFKESVENDICDSCFNVYADPVDQTFVWMSEKLKNWNSKDPKRVFYAEIMIDHVFMKDPDGNPTLFVSAKIDKKDTVFGMRINEDSRTSY